MLKGMYLRKVLTHVSLRSQHRSTWVENFCYWQFNSSLHHTDIWRPWKKAFENIVGKGENAGNQHFLLFPLYFLPLHQTSFNFSFKVISSSANAFNLEQSRILLFGKEFIFHVEGPFCLMIHSSLWLNGFYWFRIYVITCMMQCIIKMH